MALNNCKKDVFIDLYVNCNPLTINVKVSRGKYKLCGVHN
uniref:Uncharacterized protein n=1 Tax=Rhizophora mucronata TaxID=61149 RepID=A0A2P2P5Z1_RHIMU